MIIKWAVFPSTFFVQTVCVSEALEIYYAFICKVWCYNIVRKC